VPERKDFRDLLQLFICLPVSGKKASSKHRYILWPDEIFGG